MQNYNLLAEVRQAGRPVLLKRGLSATIRELLERIVELNRLEPDDVVSAFFSTTPDLTSAFPAGAARELGWTDTPLMCMAEIAVPGAPGRCIRVLLHVESAAPREDVMHVYLQDAESLRPDLSTRLSAPA